MFTDEQIHYIQTIGLSKDAVEKQIARFKIGFDSINISSAATLNSGIISIDSKEVPKYAKYFDKKKKKKNIGKFVPASGAASRMFKMLFEVLENYDGSEESYNKFFSKSDLHSPKSFFENIAEFAFYEDLKSCIENDGLNLSELIDKKDYKTILTYFLLEKGLNYGNLPKGMLKFHKYSTINRTAIEEHMVEGALYAKNTNKDVNIHFTVSPEFVDGFKETVKSIKKEYQEKYDVKYYISYSVQKSCTDTIAVNEDNSPFLNKDNSLLFRPSGHGALIENLNDLEYDVVFIKNIDNVVPDSNKKATIAYKKALGGILLYYQSTLQKLYDKVKKSKHLSDKRLKSIIKLYTEELFYTFPNDFENWPKNDCKDYILELINRPIRVCGMVKNEGEPGGGPFIVNENDGAKSLQIIEMAQIDSSSDEQMQISKQSTHFNPVDLVCTTKDLEGKKFNLKNFVDSESGIITTKSKDGKSLKALELPGLWNGAMSNWNTLFVEVPISTFNPVKEVTDLLRKEHKEK